jgi:hypothetical protein
LCAAVVPDRETRGKPVMRLSLVSHRAALLQGGMLRRCVLPFAAALLLGCAEVARLPPPPAAETPGLAVLSVGNARFFPDGPPGPMVEEARRVNERGAARRTGQFLALSGGADDGAFGAGVMLGWTATGTRPSFDVVTGISAGALIAPFAFLGPAYDEALREVFTAVSPGDVLRLPNLALSVLFRASLADTSPLSRLIERHANEAMLAAIAEEYRRGRLLLIGTTNLDVQRPVIWNIGALAASGDPAALGLFRQILLASASIPGAFPPVLIDVEHAGRRFHEMHVDGGATMQVFFYPASLELRPQRPLSRTVHVIRNGRMEMQPESERVGLFGIARRSAATLLHFAGVGDVERIRLAASRDGISFRFAHIPADFRAERPEPFDRAYMNALFEAGFAGARDGSIWRESIAPADPAGVAQRGGGSGATTRSSR